MENKKMLKDRDFKAEFNELFEECSISDIEYMLEEFDKYGWVDVYLESKEDK